MHNWSSFEKVAPTNALLCTICETKRVTVRSPRTHREGCDSQVAGTGQLAYSLWGCVSFHSTHNFCPMTVHKKSVTTVLALFPDCRVMSRILFIFTSFPRCWQFGDSNPNAILSAAREPQSSQTPFGQLCLPSLHVCNHLPVYLEGHFICKAPHTRRPTKEATAYHSAATDK